MNTHHDATDHPLTEAAAAALWDAKGDPSLPSWQVLARNFPANYRVRLAILRAVFDAGREHERTVQDVPTEPGTVLEAADGHEYITATVFGEVYSAREAILIGKTQWHAAWRSDTSVLIYVAPEHITPGIWKVDDQ